MSLENLSSVFNDISKNIKDDRVKDARSGDKPPANTSLEKQVNDTNFNILDKIDRIDIRGDSPVGNLALDAGNFSNIPFFKGNIEFKNKYQQLIGGTSFIDDDIKDNFGFTTFDDISKIEKIVKITHTLTSVFCPMADEISENIKQAGLNDTGATDCIVNLTFDPPFSMDMVPEETKLAMGWD